MRLGFFALTALFACGAVFACGSFDTSSTPPVTEAGVDGDTSGDSNSPPAADAALETSIDAGTKFCETADASFCWSFDEDIGGGYEVGPQLAKEVLTGELALVDGVSKPYALRAKTSADASTGSGVFAGVKLVLPSARSSLRCEVDVFADPGDELVTVFDVVTTGTNEKMGFTLHHTNGQLLGMLTLYRDFSSQGARSTAIPVPLRNWFHLVFVASGVGTEGGGYSVRIPTTNQMTSFSAGDAGFGIITEVRPLVFGGLNTGTWSVLYDNFECRFD